MSWYSRRCSATDSDSDNSISISSAYDHKNKKYIGEQLEVYLVKPVDKKAVELILHIVDQKVHDSFWHAVLNVFANDEEISFD